MLVLDATTKSLEVKLAGAITATQLPYVASYVDISQSTFGVVGSSESDGTTNNATAVTVMAAPGASTSRKLNFLSVFNVDTVQATVTVQVNNSGTLRICWRGLLAVGDTLQYIDEKGFLVTDVNGSLKQSGSTGATGATGAIGPVGMGVPSVDGEDGFDGWPGERGLQGFTGTTGATGPTGQGVPGIDGDDGEPGALGPQGNQGATGATGLQGPTGAIGPPGSGGSDDGDGDPFALVGITTRALVASDLIPIQQILITQFDKTANTTLSDVTGFSFNVDAGKSYIWEFWLSLTTDTVGGFKTAIGGTATWTTIRGIGLEINQARTAGFGTTTSTGTLLSDAGGSGYGVVLAYSGKVNTAGTVTLQFAQSNSSNTSSILVGSFLRVY